MKSATLVALGTPLCANKGAPYFSILLGTPVFANKGTPLFFDGFWTLLGIPCLQIRGPP